MTNLGDTYTYTDKETGKVYEFTCISVVPEYWICPTPFYDDWLVDNFGKKDEDGNAYYTINSYKVCQQIEDVINHIDQSFHSTACYDKPSMSYARLTTDLLSHLKNQLSAIKILQNDKIYLKAYIKDTNKSILFPALGFIRNNSVYGLNQTCFFTQYCTGIHQCPFQYISDLEKKYSYSALYSTCLNTTFDNFCISPFSDVESYTEVQHNLCSAIMLDATTQSLEVKTPVFIYAKYPRWTYEFTKQYIDIVTSTSVPSSDDNDMIISFSDKSFNSVLLHFINSDMYLKPGIYNVSSTCKSYTITPKKSYIKILTATYYISSGTVNVKMIKRTDSSTTQDIIVLYNIQGNFIAYNAHDSTDIKKFRFSYYYHYTTFKIDSY